MGGFGQKSFGDWVSDGAIGIAFGFGDLMVRSGFHGMGRWRRRGVGGDAGDF